MLLRSILLYSGYLMVEISVIRIFKLFQKRVNKAEISGTLISRGGDPSSRLLSGWGEGFSRSLFDLFFGAGS